MLKLVFPGLIPPHLLLEFKHGLNPAHHALQQQESQVRLDQGAWGWIKSSSRVCPQTALPAP